MDSYAETLRMLNTYVLERAFAETFAELGGSTRKFPALENVQINSCDLRHIPSNDEMILDAAAGHGRQELRARLQRKAAQN